MSVFFASKPNARIATCSQQTTLARKKTHTLKSRGKIRQHVRANRSSRKQWIAVQHFLAYGASLCMATGTMKTSFGAGNVL